MALVADLYIDKRISTKIINWFGCRPIDTWEFQPI